MIRVERALASPAALAKKFTGGQFVDKTELEAVIAALDKHLQEVAALPAGSTPKAFTFDYQRYKEDEVKKALTLLFAGKCAYCETFYAASQPMDVEHWRPKGEVDLPDGKVQKPGYYWLAADWSNLFPCCIDCNRARKQHDVVEQREVTLGKANQFPLLDEATRQRKHTDVVTEKFSLVNPCLDQPETLFTYTDDGAIIPRSTVDSERKRALDSIRVYALNRSDLVAERVAVIRLVDHRLELVSRLDDLRTALRTRNQNDLADIVEEILTIEIDALRAMTAANRPFAGLARHLLAAANL